MERLAVIDRLNALLDAPEADTVNTSMRLSASLRDAAALAVHELGLASSTTALTSQLLRQTLVAAVQQAVLDEHYEQHPDSRPSLAEVAHALAEMDGSALAGNLPFLEVAAAEVAAYRPDATADDVLLWATAQLAQQKRLTKSA